MISNLELNVLVYPYFIVRILDDIVQTNLGGNIILQPLDNIFINEEIYYHQIYDRFYDIGEYDTIVDVGAHAGVFALKAARKAKHGLVLAIEPHPFNYLLLKNNVKVNKLANIEALKLALWSSNEKSKLYLGDSGSHSLYPHNKGKGNHLEVQTKTLDSLVEEVGISGLNFIKMDTEGSELEILHGAKQTLERFDPFLSIAAYHTPTQIQEISEFLRAIGFRIFVFRSSYIYAFKSRGKVKTILKEGSKSNLERMTFMPLQRSTERRYLPSFSLRHKLDHVCSLVLRS